MTKLANLNPKLTNNILVFDCPCNNCGGRIRVPLSDGPVPTPLPFNSSTGTWGQSGIFPDSLTLTPSVNAGCWHGNITKGETVP